MKPMVIAAALAALSTPVFAGDMTHGSGESPIIIEDAYARAAGAAARAGAAFMTITNATGSDDRLIAVSSDVSERVELHTHIEDANGVMRMIEVEDGFAIPAGGTHMLKRGGDHVMFMGLNRVLEQGDVVAVTLVFEQAGEMTFEIPVDLERMDGHGGHNHMNHGSTATN